MICTIAWKLQLTSAFCSKQFSESVAKTIQMLKYERTIHNAKLNGNICHFSMGYNGRQCILRALCESAQHFFGRATNMVEELIRIVFT